MENYLERIEVPFEGIAYGISANELTEINNEIIDDLTAVESFQDLKKVEKRFCTHFEKLKNTKESPLLDYRALESLNEIYEHAVEVIFPLIKKHFVLRSAYEVEKVAEPNYEKAQKILQEDGNFISQHSDLVDVFQSFLESSGYFDFSERVIFRYDYINHKHIVSETEFLKYRSEDDVEKLEGLFEKIKILFEILKRKNLFIDDIATLGAVYIYTQREYAKNSFINHYREISTQNKNNSEILQEYFSIVDEDERLSMIWVYYLSNILTLENRSDIADLLSHEYEVYKEEEKINSMMKKMDSPQNERLDISIDIIDMLSGEEFELFLMDLFNKLGYSTNPTKTTGDQGVDILARKGDMLTAIQAKCYSSSVGNSAIQEVVAGRIFYNAHKAMVVTNNYFTNSAKDLAEKNNVILWDRDKLIEMIEFIY